jgi:riboflavin biosynthesis pyrimidine reductase
VPPPSLPPPNLAPLETLAGDARAGVPIPLAPELAAFYGSLAFPPHAGRPYVIGNFVSTLDGVVALGGPYSGGGDISGGNPQDQMLMGILRAVADVVVVAAGTLRAAPRHTWNPEAMAPRYAAAYAQTRALLGKPGPPLTVLVTAGGTLDLSLPVFQSGKTDVVIATNERVAVGLRARTLPGHVRVLGLPGEHSISVRTLLDALQQQRPCDIILTEGGPHLLAGFLAERCLDELFLTLAPQVAGRDDPARRPGLASGQEFAPEHPLWGTLVDVRRAGSHLFLRYAF